MEQGLLNSVQTTEIVKFGINSRRGFSATTSDMKLRSKLNVFLAGLAFATAAFSQVITPMSITAIGPFTNNLNVVVDGFVPPETTSWTDPVNVFWSGFDTSITVDYGSTHLITDVLLSVDNNDVYLVDYSVDGVTFTPLFTIMVDDGNISPGVGGMDTMSSDATSADYIAGIDFTSVNARFLRFQAVPGGDGLNSIGELVAFSPASGAVPEPSTYGLIGAATLVGVIVLRRRWKTNG